MADKTWVPALGHKALQRRYTASAGFYPVSCFSRVSNSRALIDPEGGRGISGAEACAGARRHGSLQPARRRERVGFAQGLTILEELEYDADATIIFIVLEENLGGRIPFGEAKTFAALSCVKKIDLGEVSAVLIKMSDRQGGGKQYSCGGAKVQRQHQPRGGF
jgi:hypothetical protein